LLGRFIAHGEDGEKIMVDEWQWNIINNQRKHKMVMEKGMEKKRKM
jgi:hypothetical protein